MAVTDRLRPVASALALASALAFAPSAFAQSNTALAESLYTEGKTLYAQKNYTAACPKFAESARIDPASGTFYGLGLCYEGQGRFASAWSAYLYAAQAARKDRNDDREKNANKKASDVEKKVPRVSFAVAPATSSLNGLELSVDGQALASASWSSAPIDAGDHKILVKATGKIDYEASFTVKAAPQKNEVTVPALADAPVVAPPPPIVVAPPPDESSGSGMRIAGFTLLGVGVVSTGVGAVFGAIALGAAGEVEKVCSVESCTDPAAVDKNESAKTFADVSTVMIIGGIALAAAGVVLVLVAPKARTVGLAPAFAPGYAGINLGGTF
ncbi:hypothetical protein BH09MYX1_BH09MYX1_39760 [soil metagenome]